MATLKRTIPVQTAGESGRLKRTLYIGGLDENVDKAILQAAFVPFGELRTVEIPKDKATGKHRGFGFVEFDEEEDATNAIDNMHEAELYGRILTVNLARTPARKLGEGSRPVWSDDTFLSQTLRDNFPMTEIPEEDDALTGLLQSTEAQEALRQQEQDASTNAPKLTSPIAS